VGGSVNKVTQERCGWRDEEISRRHRLWGVSCAAVDLDFLMLEFNYQEPIALVEYKHCKASLHTLYAGRYEALRKLCDGFHRECNGQYRHDPIPCLVARYDPSNWSFMVTPLNDRARAHYAHCNGALLTEQRFVRSLHLLRKTTLTAEDEAAISALNHRAILSADRAR
jgi:hypothetical protein